jgi:hypothetical protein
MKFLTFVFISSFFLCFSHSNNEINSPQVPDYIIYESDTLPIYTLIIEQYLDKLGAEDNGDLFGLKFREGAATYCWRGYQAIYSIKNDSLFLNQLINCGDLLYDNEINHKDSKDRLVKLFKNKIKNGKVHLDWFSGNLNLPKANLLRWDGVFHNSFEEEIQLKIRKGKIRKKNKVLNYIDDPNRINRRKDDTLSNIIFKELNKVNWNNKKEFDCSEAYIITIGKNGKVKDVIMKDYQDKSTIDKYWDKDEYKYCIKNVFDCLKKLKFDILKKDNKLIEEKIYIEFWILDDGTLENWTW